LATGWRPLPVWADTDAREERSEDMPITVTRDCPELAPFDEEMVAFMQARDVPGGALAVSRGGKLVLARGYGWADRDTRQPVAPTSLFRIASVSKPITAVAVLGLIERSEGNVSLDTPALPLLGLEGALRPPALPDPRLETVTLRQVLRHTAGWDRKASFDPMFRPLRIAQDLGTTPPAGPDDVVRYMLTRFLDHDPGAQYAYSNFGYCLLGRIIEGLSGQTYEEHVAEHLLAPLGITDMRIGHSLAEGRAPLEVRYHDPGVGRNVMTPQEDDTAPAPYGTFHLEAMDAHGGWIASAPDLVRFACALDDPQHCPILGPGAIADMFARPEGSAGFGDDGKPKAAYYGCGWLVRPKGGSKANHWHNGSLPGTSSLLVRRHDGLNWAVLFNQRKDPSGLSYGDIDPALHRAANRVQGWPEDDLFPTLFGP